MNNRILIIGLGKSGTSICHSRICDALPGALFKFEPEPAQTTLCDVALHKEFCNFPTGTVVKSLIGVHNPNRFKEIIPLYDKVIWIYRDPRDRLISSFFYNWWWGNNHFTHEDYEETITKVKIKELNPSSLSFHELNLGLNNCQRTLGIYEKLIEFIKPFGRSIFQIKYEDFIVGNVDSLESYLGFQINSNGKINDQYNRVQRSMRFGDWRLRFNNSDVEYYQPLNPVLDQLCYNSKDWNLEYPNLISSKYGSDYMERIYSNSNL